ncbi:MAG: pyridoxal phosphate-dependent aminotransferase [Acidimicrobiia bacterium]|nr:pyridoxal phosphate-dependent aminotransferase [Acidimicrobiia bacterium]NNF10573.1 pyridoxal phosphate-dependent aminotransferase [Acidimicrobiia bacterium]NNL70730.1 pyridoxal phosphate-dependent aminotransferase [Acidimicrobiia bacterium]
MYERAAELERQGRDVIHLEVGRPSFDTPPHIKQAAKDALDAGIVHYGDLRGTETLRDAIADDLNRRHGFAIGADEVLITTGLTQAAFATFMAALDPGDEVITLEPLYPQHPPKIELIGGSVVSVPLVKEDGYRLDAGVVEAAVTPRTRALLLVNPANPVGRVFSRPELEGLADVARRHDLLVVSDEVYDRIVYDDGTHVSIATLPGMWERTITLFAFTKAFAMDGWRLGYAVAPDPLISQVLRVTLNETTHPNVFAQEGALAAILSPPETVEEMVAEDKRRRDLVFDRLNAMPGVSCPRPEGAIYAFPDLSELGRTSMELAADILDRCLVATEAGSFYGASGEGHLRICFGSEPYDRLEEALDRIEAYLSEGPG